MSGHNAAGIELGRGDGEDALQELRLFFGKDGSIVTQKDEGRLSFSTVGEDRAEIGVGRHENTILLFRAFKNRFIRRIRRNLFSQMNRIQPLATELLR